MFFIASVKFTQKKLENSKTFSSPKSFLLSFGKFPNFRVKSAHTLLAFIFNEVSHWLFKQRLINPNKKKN